MVSRANIMSIGKLWPEIQNALEALPVKLSICEASAGARLQEVLPTVSGLIVRHQVFVGRDIIEKAQHLRFIARTGIGVDNIDMTAAAEYRIPVLVAPGAGANAVAEGATLMLLALVKRFSEVRALVNLEDWQERDTLVPLDLQDITVGIIGYGRIGKRFSELIECFGARTYYFDPYVGPCIRKEEGFGPAAPCSTMEQLLSKSLCVSIHCPLTDETTNLVNSAFVSKMRQGSILINTARGSIVDIDAVYKGMQEGRVVGVGLDVFPTEPPPWHPLFDMPNVVVTPHIWGISAGARRRTAELLSSDIARVLRGERPVNMANAEIYL